MGDLINRSRLKEELKSWAWLITKPQYYHREDADFVIDSQAAVDAVEVVRCKDCLYYRCDNGCPLHESGYFKNGKMLPLENDFCSYGERKEK